MNELKCVKCRNQRICKYCNDMKNKQEYIDNVPNEDTLSPITITISCSQFNEYKGERDNPFMCKSFQNKSYIKSKNI